MFHFYETSKSEIWNVEMVFPLNEKASNISFYVSFMKEEGNSEEV